MELQPLSEDMFRFAYRRSVYLAIATSIRDESIGDDVPQLNREQEGWIVRGTEIFPWVHRPLCINETVHIIGPYLEGVTLAERMSNNEISLGYINRLTRALTILERRGIHLHAIHNQAIIFCAMAECCFWQTKLYRCSVIIKGRMNTRTTTDRSIIRAAKSTATVARSATRLPWQVWSTLRSVANDHGMWRMAIC